MPGMDDLPGSAQQPRRTALEPALTPHLAPSPPVPGAGPDRPTAKLALGALAAAAIVGGLVWWGLAPRSASLEDAFGPSGQVLEPITPRADVRTGEQVAPFSGFAVSVDTEPSGAVVTVAGVPRGEAPVLVGVECTPGATVEIAAEKGGFAVARAGTTCRADTLVKLTVRLRR